MTPRVVIPRQRCGDVVISGGRHRGQLHPEEWLALLFDAAVSDRHRVEPPRGRHRGTPKGTVGGMP